MAENSRSIRAGISQYSTGTAQCELSEFGGWAGGIPSSGLFLPNFGVNMDTGLLACSIRDIGGMEGGRRRRGIRSLPPAGQRSFSDLADGLCYLNNSAISAQIFRGAGLSTAVIDVDLHHGNGTQGIFCSRSDDLTVSVHRDTSSYYPHFRGYAHERGEGLGLGSNLSLPFAGGTGDNRLLEAIDVSLERIRPLGAQSLVVVLGLVAHEGDPFGGSAEPTEGFARIAEATAKLSLPTFIVQEGGYLNAAQGRNLSSFLSAFLNVRDCRNFG